jgi:hypothetical protein
MTDDIDNPNETADIVCEVCNERFFERYGLDHHGCDPQAITDAWFTSNAEAIRSIAPQGAVHIVVGFDKGISWHATFDSACDAFVASGSGACIHDVVVRPLISGTALLVP